MGGDTQPGEPRRSLEDEKLHLEVRKLREDLSVWSRVAAIVIPIAVFFIGAAQTYIAGSDWASRNRQEAFDTDMKKLESGIKSVEFATAEAQHIASANHVEARQAITYIGTLLPPDMACQMLNAVLLNVRIEDDLSEYVTSMRAQLAKAEAPAPQSCTASPRDRQDQAILAMAQEQVTVAGAAPAPAPPPPSHTAPAVSAPVQLLAPPAAVQEQPVAPTASASSCQAPAWHDAVAFVVYYQIVRQEDRDKASQIGFQIPVQFPSAGIDYVAETDPSKQKPDVRFYHQEQEPAARYLACLLSAAYAKVLPGGPPVQFAVTSLERQYKNLPAKRVEVWFPPLAGS